MIHSMGSTSVRSASIAEFAADCPLRTPMCYFGGVEMESGASLPLLEDLSWVRNLKSAGGCVDDAELVIREIGRLHAALVGRCSPRQNPVAPDEGHDDSPRGTTGTTHWELFGQAQHPVTEELVSPEALCARYLPALAVSMHTEPPQRRGPTPPAALLLVAGVRFVRFSPQRYWLTATVSGW